MNTSLVRAAGRVWRALDDFPANHAANFKLLAAAVVLFVGTVGASVVEGSVVGVLAAAVGLLICVAAGVDRWRIMRAASRRRVSAGQGGAS